MYLGYHRPKYFLFFLSVKLNDDHLKVFKKLKTAKLCSLTIKHIYSTQSSACTKKQENIMNSLKWFAEDLKIRGYSSTSGLCLNERG